MYSACSPLDTQCLHALLQEQVQVHVLTYFPQTYALTYNHTTARVEYMYHIPTHSKYLNTVQRNPRSSARVTQEPRSGARVVSPRASRYLLLLLLPVWDGPVNWRLRRMIKDLLAYLAIPMGSLASCKTSRHRHDKVCHVIARLVSGGIRREKKQNRLLRTYPAGTWEANTYLLYRDPLDSNLVTSSGSWYRDDAGTTDGASETGRCLSVMGPRPGSIESGETPLVGTTMDTSLGPANTCSGDSQTPAGGDVPRKRERSVVRVIMHDWCAVCCTHVRISRPGLPLYRSVANTDGSRCQTGVEQSGSATLCVGDLTFGRAPTLIYTL